MNVAMTHRTLPPRGRECRDEDSRPDHRTRHAKPQRMAISAFEMNQAHNHRRILWVYSMNAAPNNDCNALSSGMIWKRVM